MRHFFWPISTPESINNKAVTLSSFPNFRERMSVHCTFQMTFIVLL